MLKTCFALLLFAASFVSAQTTAPEGVYYEIFVRSFQDSDGDGVGDLAGATERLDYLEDLGVTGVWLMPIHPSPSYHGYDVTDFYEVNPDYGTLEDFDTFVSEAHARGIRVVIDLVVNHTSDRHPWFLKAKINDPDYRDYYSWSDTNLGWRGTGGAPAWHETGSGYYLGLFWSGMPDLNYRNDSVVQAMDEVARFWLQRGVDGFRIDAIQHIVESTDGQIRNTPENIAWVKDFEAFIKTVRPDAFLVGETWTDAGTIATYFTDGDLDAAFDYPLWSALLDAVQSPSALNLAFTLKQNAELYPPDASLATFIANHDQVRPATSLGFLKRDVPRLKLAAGLLLTLPGTPFLYYGEEIGLPNGPGDKDEEKRTPMRWTSDEPYAGFSAVEPWYPFSTDDPAITVAAQADDPDSLLRWYEQLIKLRHETPALQRGSLTVLETEDRSLLAFCRAGADEAGGEGVGEGVGEAVEGVLVVANFGNQEAALELSSLGTDRAVDLLTTTALSGTLTLPKTSLAVLEVAAETCTQP